MPRLVRYLLIVLILTISLVPAAYACDGPLKAYLASPVGVMEVPKASIDNLKPGKSLEFSKKDVPGKCTVTRKDRGYSVQCSGKGWNFTAEAALAALERCGANSNIIILWGEDKADGFNNDWDHQYDAVGAHRDGYFTP